MFEHEQVIECPFCGDKPGRHHKHCYVNRKKGVFFCHLCETGGTINYLLEQAPFLDEELDIGEIIKKARPRKNLSHEKMKRLVLVENSFSKKVIEYLKNRGLTTEEVSEVYWKSSLPGRAIFVCKERREIVYWTGRGIGSQKPKYVFPRDGETGVSRDQAIYRYDIFENMPSVPELWIAEGVFDALAVNGIAIFGKRAFNGQLRKILSLMPKKIVIALDKDARDEAELIRSKLKDLVPTEIVFPPDRWSDWGESLKDGYRRT